MKNRQNKNALLKRFLKDVDRLCELPAVKKYPKLLVAEFPFDNQLLNLSKLYRQSRKFYLTLGGRFTPKVCSTMRALSTQDLFKNEIEYTPGFSEMLWFRSHAEVLPDPLQELEAHKRFNDISLYHEQNHRVVWQLLPPAPNEQQAIRRYLNFAESLVVTLDLALGDEIGTQLSPSFERLNILYRPGVKNKWNEKSSKEYRKYLLSVLCATYFVLERVDSRDILKAVNYLFPVQSPMNFSAVKRSLELNEQFTEVTNPNWQQIYWQSAVEKLQKIHRKSKEPIFYLPEDPLDLQDEFFYAERIFDYFGL